MDDALELGLIIVGMPFAVIAISSWLLHYFVQLNAPPTQRAAWIVGIGYAISSTIWLFAGPAGDRWEGPFAAIPGAALAFWWWRRDFRYAWIDDGEELPEGVSMANTDWRVGLFGLLAMLVAAAIKVTMVRHAVSN